MNSLLVKIHCTIHWFHHSCTWWKFSKSDILYSC